MTAPPLMLTPKAKIQARIDEMKHSIYAGDTTRKEFQRRALKMPMHEPRKDPKWLEAAIWGGMMAAFASRPLRRR